jgi:hypothetical protein
MNGMSKTLREHAVKQTEPVWAIMINAANEIDTLTRRVEELEGALRKIATDVPCDCGPRCVGNCESEQRIKIELEERIGLARDTVSAKPPTIKPATTSFNGDMTKVQYYRHFAGGLVAIYEGFCCRYCNGSWDSWYKSNSYVRGCEAGKYVTRLDADEAKKVTAEMPIPPLPAAALAAKGSNERTGQ